MLKILITDNHKIARWGIIQFSGEKYPFPYFAEAVEAEPPVQKTINTDWDIDVLKLGIHRFPGNNKKIFSLNMHLTTAIIFI